MKPLTTGAHHKNWWFTPGTLFTYPYLFLSVRTGQQGIDPALEEAARSLGYSARSTFFQVILPQLRPALLAGGLLVALTLCGTLGHLL
ncbi:MAG TPA: ABC transporter permease subunit [Candidatus Caenarcaniphilales bacterium]